MPDLNRRKFLNGATYPLGTDSVIDLSQPDSDTPWRVQRVISDCVVAEDRRTVYADTSYRDIQVYIPTAVGAQRPITVKKLNVGGGVLAVSAPSGQTIEGDVIFTVGDGRGYTFISDNVNWYGWANVGGGGGGWADALPAGVILGTGNLVGTGGWMVCGGDWLLRSVYTDLFAAIGTTFGAADGADYFAIPNFHGKMPFGVKPTLPGAGKDIADTFGDKLHTHPGTGWTATSAVPYPPQYYRVPVSQEEPGLVPTSHTHTITTATFWEEDSVPSLTINFQIKLWNG